jgi:nicotinamide mononucleotide transporter
MIDSIKTAIITTSTQEWLAVLFAVLYVILIAHKIIWCWLFGIASSVIYVFICYTGKLYLESILSVFYVIMGLYGWLQWNKKSSENDKNIFVLNREKLFRTILILFMLSVLTGYIFHKYTKASWPFLDAPITIFSLYATWLATKKYIENWIFWIFIDAASILLFANREYYLSALLYLLYTLIAVYGYFQWRKAVIK